MNTKMNAELYQRVETMFHQAEEQERLGNNEEAEKFYTEAIMAYEVVPTSEAVRVSETESHSHTISLAYNNRGCLRYRKVDFDQAVEDYTSALKFEPRLAVSLYNRGLIHYRLGHFNKAIEDQKAALDVDPNFSSAQHCLEESLTCLKNLSKEKESKSDQLGDG